MEGFLACIPHHSGNSSFDSYFPLKVLASEISVPLGISSDRPQSGYENFLELHNTHMLTSENQINLMYLTVTPKILLILDKNCVITMFSNFFTILLTSNCPCMVQV